MIEAYDGFWEDFDGCPESVQVELATLINQIIANPFDSRVVLAYQVHPFDRLAFEWRELGYILRWNIRNISPPVAVILNLQAE